MSNVLPPEGSAKETPPPPRRRLWVWFVIGFVLVFFGLAIAYPMHFYDGLTVRQTMLWHYYILEIDLAWNDPGLVGPTTGNSAVAIKIFVQHLCFSALGGVVNMAIGSIVKKVQAG